MCNLLNIVKSLLKEYAILALAGVAQLVGASSYNLRVAGSISGQGPCLGCSLNTGRFDPLSRRKQEATNQCFSCADVSLSPFPTL